MENISDELKAKLDEATKQALAYMQALPAEQLEEIWQLSTLQIGLIAAEKARRLGLAQPKIAIIAVDGEKGLEALQAQLGAIAPPGFVADFGKDTEETTFDDEAN